MISHPPARTLFWLALLVTLVVAPGLPAQRHWRVDANNGPGTDFVSIADAVASTTVRSGDVLLVEAGRYASFATGKGLAIVANGAVTVHEGVSRAAVTIENLPQGQSLRLQGLRLEHSCAHSNSAIFARDNAGMIVFDDIESRGSGYPSWLMPFCQSASFTRCALVIWNRGQVLGGSGIDATDTTLVLNTVRADGLDGRDLIIRRIPATAGLTMNGGAAYLTDVQINGGNGANEIIAMPGVLSFFSTKTNHVEIAHGPHGSSINAGRGLGAMPALVLGNQTTAIVDPAVALNGSNGAGPVFGGTFRRQPLGLVVATGAAPGGTATITLMSPPGRPILLGISYLTAGAPGPLGPLFLDLNQLVPLVVGTQNASGSTTRNLPVPNTNTLRGATLGVQAAVAYTSPPGVRVTNPAVLVVR